MIRKKPIRIFHADRHMLLRQGVRTKLERDSVEVIGEADNPNDMMEGIAVCKPDLLMVSHKLYNEKADTFLPKVKKRFPALKILMLTMAYDRNHLLKYRNNLDGMIGKCAEFPELVSAIHTIVLEGKIYYSLDIYLEGGNLLGHRRSGTIRKYESKQKEFFDSINYHSNA